MLVKDIMTTQVITVEPNATLHEVIKLIVEIEISGLMVIEPNGDVFGVITEKDALVAYDFLKDLKAPITDFVCKDLISVTADTSVEEVSKILVQNNILRVPVLEGKKLVGIISRRDILKCIYKQK